MHIYVNRPTKVGLKENLKKQEQLSFSYVQIGAVTQEVYPPGFDHDRNRCLLGEGPGVFAEAKRLISHYQHFPTDWTFVFSGDQQPEAGLLLTTTFQQFGLWWVNGLRVIEVIDEPHFYGFSYGTLTSHVECGEELFYTEMLADGKVYYGIKAFSRPRFWGARLLKPYARSQQRRFVHDSMKRMQLLTSKVSKNG